MSKILTQVFKIEGEKKLSVFSNQMICQARMTLEFVIKPQNTGLLLAYQDIHPMRPGFSLVGRFVCRRL